MIGGEALCAVEFLLVLTAGRLEGFNNKIKVLKRVVYGSKDDEHFKLEIYDLHKAKYAIL